MRGTTVKLINLFARNSWERTEKQDRPKSYKNFRRNIKREWNRNSDFQKFVKLYADGTK